MTPFLNAKSLKILQSEAEFAGIQSRRLIQTIMDTKLFQQTFLWFILIGLSFLVGCASPAQLHPMIAQNLPQTLVVHGPAFVTVKGGQETNPWRVPEISDEDFTAAVIESLKKTHIFESVGPSGPAAFHLDITIKRFRVAYGFNIPATLTTEWQLIRTSDNKLIWDKQIDSSDTATMGDAIIASNRARLATEAAGRKNIEQGLANLAEVNF